MNDVKTEVAGKAGRITLDRPRALNALSLAMIRELTATLLAWRDDPRVEVVTIRGTGKEGPFGAFCAGGDIRFFHAAALAGNPELEDFFTEEYTLNHLVHHYPKPYVAFMDGIVMGGGMGLCQGAALADPAGEQEGANGKPFARRHGSVLRVVTERTKMAMPETGIGLFPDVGGGYFLSRCPGHLGEYLALTGEVIAAADAVDARLADVVVPSADLPALWERLAGEGAAAAPTPQRVQGSRLADHRPGIDEVFALGSVREIVAALEAGESEWAKRTAAVLRKRSPLMLHVVLEQLRRARSMNLADDLRMERGLVRHCFHLRPDASETVEGVRALAIDKDHSPRWNPARIEDVTPGMVEPFFGSPWPGHAHPLRGLD